MKNSCFTNQKNKGEKMANPILNSDSVSKRSYGDDAMSYQGVIGKTMALFIVFIVSAIYSWNKLAVLPNSGDIMVFSAIAGFVAAMVCIFCRSITALCSPVYAFLQGIFLGIFTSMMEKQYPGIAVQSTLLTFGCFLSVLTLYWFKILEYSDKAMKFILASMAGILLVYFVSIIASLFGHPIELLGGGWTGIGFSLFVVGIASWSFILDFHRIEEGVNNGYSSENEWYVAFGLIVGLIWLYVELINLISKIRNE